MANILEESNWQNNGMRGMVMGKCKDKQKESFYNETMCKHFQGWYGALQELKNKVLKQPVNCRMKRLAIKPQNVYDSKKKWWIKNWMRNQNFVLYIEL
jgi:hypothetical protein